MPADHKETPLPLKPANPPAAPHPAPQTEQEFRTEDKSGLNKAQNKDEIISTVDADSINLGPHTDQVVSISEHKPVQPKSIERKLPNTLSSADKSSTHPLKTNISGLISPPQDFPAPHRNSDEIPTGKIGTSSVKPTESVTVDSGKKVSEFQQSIEKQTPEDLLYQLRDVAKEIENIDEKGKIGLGSRLQAISLRLAPILVLAALLPKDSMDSQTATGPKDNALPAPERTVPAIVDKEAAPVLGKEQESPRDIEVVVEAGDTLSGIIANQNPDHYKNPDDSFKDDDATQEDLYKKIFEVVSNLDNRDQFEPKNMALYEALDAAVASAAAKDEVLTGLQVKDIFKAVGGDLQVFYIHEGDVVHILGEVASSTDPVPPKTSSPDLPKPPVEPHQAETPISETSSIGPIKSIDK